MSEPLIRQHDSDSLFLSYHGDAGYYFPYTSADAIDSRMHLMSKKGPFDKWLLDKYTTPRIGISPTDTVIDCGAFVGAFSIAAYKQQAKKVFSIEPSSKNFRCTNLNIDHYGAGAVVESHHLGLGDKEDTLELNLSSQSCEDSFLPCDMGFTGNTELVKVRTLDWFIEQHSIDSDNLYLKVEAEGFELEIIQGLQHYKPRVITVDVSPERNGCSPRRQIAGILGVLGYQLTNTKRCLFGVRK